MKHKGDLKSFTGDGSGGRETCLATQAAYSHCVA